MNYLQLIPIYITFFLVMSSIFNQDVKGLFWLVCAIVGVGTAHVIHDVCMPQTPVLLNGGFATPLAPVLEWVNRYDTLSLSSFFITFTFIYLALPMQKNNDWNYFVILGFLILYIVDVYSKPFQTSLGIFLGSAMGSIYGLLCYWFATTVGGDSLVYFNIISSNNVYCSRPKKQQFKCYVYKNGQVISAT
jgi:hypothetical protein